MGQPLSLTFEWSGSNDSTHRAAKVVIPITRKCPGPGWFSHGLVLVCL